MKTALLRLQSTASSFESDLDALLEWDVREAPEVRTEVERIVAEIATNGDHALLEFTSKFDEYVVECAEDLRLDNAECEHAWRNLEVADRSALEYAADRIRKFHEHQRDGAFEYLDDQGNLLGQRVLPLDRVGIYVPGGTAAYPSSVLMTAIPARVANVGELVVTVPTPRGERHPLVLAALHLVGADRIYTVGGAQAIAALAYGTETIPKVDKIVGPGGRWVAAAKKVVFGAVGIDGFAGPSEILIISDGSANPSWLAWDLLAQAEHDEAAQAMLVSTSTAELDAVEQTIQQLLPKLPRAAIAERSLSERGALIQVPDLDVACTLANRIAPEHLQLMVTEPDAVMAKVRHGGALFLGSFSAEVIGDYVAGPSHVLPTFGTARYASPLGVYDFVRRSSVVRLSPDGADMLARAASTLAELEGLHAHAGSARQRIPGFDANVDGS